MFKNRKSLVEKLHQKFRKPESDVNIRRQENRIILKSLTETWDSLFESLYEFPDEYMKDGRNQPDMQERD